jgi:hypothetical protein
VQLTLKSNFSKIIYKISTEKENNEQRDYKQGKRLFAMV